MPIDLYFDWHKKKRKTEDRVKVFTCNVSPATTPSKLVHYTLLQAAVFDMQR
jgi:hypothetical protein